MSIFGTSPYHDRMGSLRDVLGHCTAMSHANHALVSRSGFGLWAFKLQSAGAYFDEQRIGCEPGETRASTKAPAQQHDIAPTKHS